VIWIEVLGRGGVEQRARLERLPALIGRGYGSDVLVDDPLADAAHARLVSDETGALRIEDLGTVNGTTVNGETYRAAAVAVLPGSIVRIGRTRLRLATSDMAVPPAAVALHSDSAELTPRQRGMLALIPLAGLVLMVVSGWLSDTEDDPASLATGGVVFLLLVAAWAGAWALGGRLSPHRRAHFAEHNALAWLFLLGVTATGWIFGWLDFLTESRALEIVGYVVSGILFVWLINGHLRFTSRLEPRRRLLVALLVTIGLGGIGSLVAQAGNELAGRELTVSATLKPVAPGMVPADSIGGFLEEVAELKESIDAEDGGDE